MTPEPAAAPPQTDLLDAFWRASGARGTTVLLVLLLAATVAVAALVPQIPAGLDAAAAQRWLAATSADYGAFGTLMRSAGIFSTLGGAWLRVLLAVLAYHLMIRAAEKGSRVRRMYTSRGDEDRNAKPASRSATVGSLLLAFGPLLIILGLLLNARSGWRADAMTLAPGSTTLLPASGGWQIGLNAISGPDTSAVAAFNIIRPDGLVRDGAVGYATPFTWSGVWVAQRATGSALAVSGSDAEGRPLKLRAQVGGAETRDAVYLLFTQAETEQAFEAPEQNVAFRAVSYPALPERGITGPVFLVEAYRGDDPGAPVVDQLVEIEARMEIDGASYLLRRDRHTVLDVSYLPGLASLAAGGLVLLAGAALCVMRFRPRPATPTPPASENIAANVATEEARGAD